MNKKAQGLPFNVIIIAIILIIVLALVLFLFNKQWTGFNSSLESCALRGGDCNDGGTDCKGAFLEGEYKECNKDQGCCIKFPTPTE